MPAYNCRESLLHLTDETMEAALSLGERHQRGIETPTLNDALMLITTELHSWGMDGKEQFRAPFVPELCLEILTERDHKIHVDWRTRCRTTDDVYEAFFPEYENLLKILSGRQDVDVERGWRFCLALNMVGLRQWKSLRRGLAA
jgi:hypothetical protein